MDVATEFKAAIDAVIADYKAKAKDGLTIPEIWELSSNALATFVSLAGKLKTLSGADKKKLVMDAAADFYDKVIAPIDIPRVPNFVEVTVVDPAVRQLWLMLADGAVEALVNIFNKSDGWFKEPADDGTWKPTTPTGNPALPPGFTPY